MSLTRTNFINFINEEIIFTFIFEDNLIKDQISEIFFVL
jgi:hypothetical protein